jgi:hypothetical protein
MCVLGFNCKAGFAVITSSQMGKGNHSTCSRHHFKAPKRGRRSRGSKAHSASCHNHVDL